MAPPTKTLPEDLLYPVLSYLHGMISTITKFSTISKAWVRPARSYIFKDITVQCVAPLTNDQRTFSTFLPFMEKHPEICVHVQTLCLSPGLSSLSHTGHPIVPSSVAALVSLCPQLHSLTLSMVDLISGDSDARPSHDVTPSLLLRQLTFRERKHTALHVQGFLDLLAYFSSIQHLDLDFNMAILLNSTPSFSDKLTEILDKENANKDLKIARISCDMPALFLSTLCGTDLSSLRRVEVTIARGGDVQSTGDLLAAAGDVIFCYFHFTRLMQDAFRLIRGMPVPWSDLRLGDCRQLKSITLRAAIIVMYEVVATWTDPAISAFRDISNLLPTTIKLVTFHVDLVGGSEPPIVCAQGRHWNLPGLVESLISRITALRKIVFVFNLHDGYTQRHIQSLYHLRQQTRDELSKFQDTIVTEVIGVVGHVPPIQLPG